MNKMHEIRTLKVVRLAIMKTRACACMAPRLNALARVDDSREPSELPYADIDRVHCRELTYNDFFSKYMLSNRPVIIQGLTEMWKSKKNWTRIRNGKEEPNPDAFSELFGDDVVPVHMQHQKGFATARPVKRESTVSEYASWWHENHENGQKHDASFIF